jgi:hypothetical protein
MANKAGSVKVVEFPALCVVAPGADPGSISPFPVIEKLDFKFSLRTDEQLVDQYGKANAAIKALEKWAEAAKGVLKERLPQPEIEAPTICSGERYVAEYTKSERTALSNERVKKFVGEEVYPSLCTTTEVLTLKVKAVA